MSKNGISRRNFLKTGALSTLALGGGLACTRTESKSRASRPGDARNVIFLVSDGMSSGTLALADLLSKGRNGKTSNWISLYESDRVYHRGLMDMASLDSNVTDSAAAASSWGCGKRVNNDTVNMGSNEEIYKPVGSVFKDAGKAVGLVTTTRITHATPAGFSANVPSRNMEDQIALQYAERGFDVLLGGGRRHFDASRRRDGVDLMAQFRNSGYDVVLSKDEMQKQSSSGKLLGLFYNSHLPYSVDHASDPGLQREVPSLAEMTRTALGRLSTHADGFLLQIEGGRVDHAAHGNDPAGMLYDQLAFDDAIAEVLRFADGRDDTLIILATDHGNANPGLGGLGAGYRDSPKMLETIHAYKHSFEWIHEQLGYHWTMDSLPGVSASRVRELVEYATGTAITRDQSQLIVHAYSGTHRPPFHDRRSPGAVLAGVMANYNGIYFVGTNHTADYVEIAAWGPGSDRIPPFVRNTAMFDLMVDMAGVRAYA